MRGALFSALPVNHESENVTDMCLLWWVVYLRGRGWNPGMSLAGGRKQSHLNVSCTYVIQKVANSKHTQAHLNTVWFNLVLHSQTYGSKSVSSDFEIKKQLNFLY